MHHMLLHNKDCVCMRKTDSPNRSQFVKKQETKKKNSCVVQISYFKKEEMEQNEKMKGEKVNNRVYFCMGNERVEATKGGFAYLSEYEPVQLTDWFFKRLRYWSREQRELKGAEFSFIYSTCGQVDRCLSFLLFRCRSERWPPFFFYIQY